MSFLALSARESSLVQTFCESCVRLDITHQSVHMARRFVIQGCPTLMHSMGIDKLVAELNAAQESSKSRKRYLLQYAKYVS